MTWRARAVRYVARLDRFPWLLLAVVTAALLLAVAASVATFLSVNQARATSSLAASFGVRYEGTSPSGALLDNGTILLTIRWTVTNPSSRSLAFDGVSYLAWIEDLSAEAGLPNLTRKDLQVTNASGTHLLYLASYGSSGVSPTPVPAGGQGTQTMEFTLTKSNNNASFEAVQNITEYAASVRGSASSVAWFWWTEITLRIDGVPDPPASAALYQLFLSRVVLDVGENYLAR